LKTWAASTQNFIYFCALIKHHGIISKYGFWILCHDTEYFVAFSDYPAFKNVPVDQIFNLQSTGNTQLRWPDIDVDIEIEALENPERFPLLYR